ncbi:MAG: DNA polymerase III subunit gamma/tau [Bacilli bacterium]
MYQTLYRKYRPLNLDEVVGQQVIVKTLKNAILNNQLSHAYLFTGPRGTGKTSIAKILARTINCTNLNDTTPCNKCVNCTQNLNQPVDIIEIDAASNNGVDEIRELKSKVNLVPTINKYKVYIIDEVHMLTTGAFNALLKTLEEPPAHIIFILATTEPHKIPMTILSRCQRFDFKRISNQDLVKRLKYVVDQEKIKIEENCLEEIARLSNGGMRDALSILDQVNAYADDQIKIEQIHEINGTLTPVEIKNFILNIKNKKLEEILELIEQYDNKGKDFVKLAEEILVYLKNLIFKFNVPKYFESLNIDFNDYDIEKIDIDELMNYVQNFNDIINELKKSSNPKLIFELSIIKIISKNNNSEEVKTDIPVIPKEKPKAEKKKLKNKLQITKLI